MKQDWEILVGIIVAAAFALHLIVTLLLRKRLDDHYNRNIIISEGRAVERTQRRREKGIVDLPIDDENTGFWE